MAIGNQSGVAIHELKLNTTKFTASVFYIGVIQHMWSDTNATMFPPPTFIMMINNKLYRQYFYM